MEYDMIVAGTGFESRAGRIRLAVRPGMPVILKQEPNNPYDPNAIAVLVPMRRWFTLFRQVEVHIGYIKRERAKFFIKKIAEGGKIVSARVKSMYTEMTHPRVSLTVETDW